MLADVGAGVGRALTVGEHNWLGGATAWVSTKKKAQQAARPGGGGGQSVVADKRAWACVGWWRCAECQQRNAGREDDKQNKSETAGRNGCHVCEAT